MPILTVSLDEIRSRLATTHSLQVEDITITGLPEAEPEVYKQYVPYDDGEVARQVEERIRENMELQARLAAERDTTALEARKRALTDLMVIASQVRHDGIGSQYNKIGAIKAMRTLAPGLGLKDAKDLVEDLLGTGITFKPTFEEVCYGEGK